MKNKPLSENLIKLVDLLSTEERQAGDKLGELLGISRNAIWKMVNKLKEYNIDIDTYKGSGYRLTNQLTLIDKDKIIQNINFNLKPISLAVFETVDSTNDLSPQEITSNDGYYVAISEHQQAGKGRLNRTWVSPFGKNIYLSVTYKTESDFQQISGLSLIVSLAIRKTLAKYLPSEKLKIKWPNDIYYDQHKLCGNLTKISGHPNDLLSITIGIGINVNQLTFDKSISDTATSMQIISGINYDRNTIISALIDELINYLNLYKDNGLEYFSKEWKENDYLYDRSIEITNVSSTQKGVAAGVNKFGHLAIKMQSGEIEYFTSGDTSIKSFS